MFDKTAIITGASGGIGSETARAFAAAGYNVVLGCRSNTAAAEQLAQDLEKTGAQAFAFSLDVADPAQTEALACAAISRCGGADVLVNCAGTSLFALATQTTDEQYDALFDTNMRGVFNCCHSVLPHMINRKRGAIVNISSMWGLCGASCETVYSAAKAAVIGFTRALAKEVAPSGITVNCVAPGVIDTPMNARYSAADMRALAEQTPLGRIGTAADVAQAVLYLARAEFVTAQVLTVDGGFIA